MIKGENISKIYGEKIVLSNVSFMIPSKSILGLLGPNGAGKTTLIRLLTRIITPDKGKILINGKLINKINAKKIGYLPEERGLYKKMKVGEQAIYFSVLKGLTQEEAKKELKKWFDKLNISDWWEKRVDTLSKGMQQKVQFIISVIHKPDLLILDEPFSGLDPVNTEELGNEILNLKKEGMTIILSTHNMSSVEQFCDQAILMNKGKIILSGQVDEIKQLYKTYTYEFRFRTNPELFLNQLNEKKIKLLSANDNNGIFCVQAQFKNESEAEAILADNIKEIHLTSFKEILPSMHDIFIASIKK